MLEKSCGWWLIWYFLFFCHGGAEGQLQWVVKEKITDYGQDLTLFCPVENCCSKHQAGWFVGGKSKILDVKTFSNDPNSKYHGTYNTDGIGFVIRNLSEADLNVTYHCNYGFNESTPTLLRHGDVFKENVPDKDKDKENNPVTIVLSIVGAIVVIVVVVAIIIVYRRKNKRQKSKGSATEKEPLNLDDQQDLPTVDVQQSSYYLPTGKNVQWQGSISGAITSITSNTNIEKYSGSTTTTPSLTILNASSSDAGTSTCCAISDVGTGQSTTTTLSVTENSPPKPEEFPLIEVVVSAPGQPRNIKVNVLSPNRIKVSWLPPTDSANIRSYNIYFNDSSVMEHPDSNYVLEGLIPDTVYHIQVSAITNGGEGEKSPLIDVKTSPLIGTEGEKRHLTTSDDQIKNEQDLEEINKTGDLEEHLPEDLYGAIVEKYKSEPKIPKDLLDDKMFLSKLLQECGKNTEGLNLDFSGGIDVVYFPATLLVVVMKYRPETKIVEEVVNDMLTTLTSQSPSTVVIVYHRSVKTAKTGVNKEKCQEQTDIFKRFSKKHNFYYNDSSCLQHSIK